MKELTQEQKVYVLRFLVDYYNRKPDLAYCICGMIEEVLEKDFEITIGFIGRNIHVFPEFFDNRPEGKRPNEHWFTMFEWEPRLEYCKNILKLIEGK